MDSETLHTLIALMSPLYGIGVVFLKKVFDTDRCVQKIKTFLKMKYADDPQIEALK